MHRFLNKPPPGPTPRPVKNKSVEVSHARTDNHGERERERESTNLNPKAVASLESPQRLASDVGLVLLPLPNAWKALALRGVRGSP